MTNDNLRSFRSYHVSNLGSFRPDGLLVDLDGYVPLPGADVTEFRWADDDWAEAMLDGEEWSGATWDDLLARNERLSTDAESSLDKWREETE